MIKKMNVYMKKRMKQIRCYWSEKGHEPVYVKTVDAINHETGNEGKAHIHECKKCERQMVKYEMNRTASDDIWV